MTDYVSFKTLKRPKSPNTFLVAPENLCLASEPDLISPIIPETPERIFAELTNLIENERRWTTQQASPESGQIRFVAETAFFKFKDDIDIRVLPAATSGAESPLTQVAIYSRSRKGYSDLGANKKRVEGIIKSLTAK